MSAYMCVHLSRRNARMSARMSARMCMHMSVRISVYIHAAYLYRCAYRYTWLCTCSYTYLSMPCLCMCIYSCLQHVSYACTDAYTHVYAQLAHTCTYKHGVCDEGTIATHHCPQCAEFLCKQCHCSHGRLCGAHSHTPTELSDLSGMPGTSKFYTMYESETAVAADQVEGSKRVQAIAAPIPVAVVGIFARIEHTLKSTTTLMLEKGLCWVYCGLNGVFHLC